MKILHVTDCYLPRLGGIETQVHALARAQLAAGHRVEVLTATPRGRHDHTRREVIDGVPLIRASVDLPFELPVHPRTRHEVASVLDGGDYQVVHVHAGVVSPFAFGALAVVVGRLPLVVTVHSLWGHATPGFRLLHSLTRWGRWPAALTAVSQVAAEPVRRAARGTRVDVLPNGIDDALWRVDPLPRDPAEVDLMAVMRLAPRKRPLPLLRILRSVREQVPDAIRLRMSVAGEGPARAAMDRYLRRHRMADWVHLLGRLTPDALRERYRRVDAFLAPARLESFGIAALEARAAGLPVVAMTRTGITEFVRSPAEGLLAASDRGFAEAVARLSADRDLRVQIAAHNRAVPPSQTWPEVLRRSDAIYARAAALVGAGEPGLGSRR